ncbi:HAD domain-containing protein [Cupriavidus sp. 8B]
MILFLDYDGVLHPDAAYLVNGRPELHADGELFMWAPVLEGILRPYPDVRIVLSTSWVRVLGFSRARDYLSPELRARVIGATWHSAMRRHSEASHRVDESWFNALSRYEQIARYIVRGGPRAANWIAVDDDADGWDERLRNRLVKTDEELGLSSLDAQEELRIVLRELAGE